MKEEMIIKIIIGVIFGVLYLVAGHLIGTNGLLSIIGATLFVNTLK